MPSATFEFEAGAKVYGKVGGFAHPGYADKAAEGVASRALLLDGGDTWQGSATALWTNGGTWWTPASRLVWT